MGYVPFLGLKPGSGPGAMPLGTLAEDGFRIMPVVAALSRRGRRYLSVRNPIGVGACADVTMSVDGGTVPAVSASQAFGCFH